MILESIQIISKISPLLALYISDLKIIKDNYLEDVLSDISEDSSLDDIYLKDKAKNSDYDEDINNFDVNSYLSNQSTENIDYNDLNNKLWARISLALNQINFNQNFCDPLKDFPSFVKSLFAIKDEIDPIKIYYNSITNKTYSFTLKSCIKALIKLISKYSMNSDPNFIIWDLPEALYNDNFIYLSLLLELSDTNNPIWINFTKSAGSLNLFFDHYLPLIGPSNDLVTSLLVGLIDSIFRNPEIYENIKMPKKQANSFWFKLMRIIGCSNNTTVVTTAFCAAKSLYLQMTPLMQKSVKIDWLNNLIDASSNGTTNSYREFYKISSDYVIKNDEKNRNPIKNSIFYRDSKVEEPKKIVLEYRYCPVHYQVLEFIFNTKVPNFKYITLCKSLINQGIASPNDLFYIQRCLMVPKIKKPFLGLKYLLNIATSDKMWSSVATRMLYEPLVRFSNLGGVQSLFNEFIRRAFIFIGISTMRQKYGRRRMMILNVFRDLYCDIKIDWLNTTIIKYYAALVFSKKLKHIVPEFSLTTSSKKADKLAKISASKQTESSRSISSSLSTESVDSIKSTKSSQSSRSSRSAHEIKSPSISSFNSAINMQQNENVREIKTRVQYDKMFPNEVDRIAKTQVNLKKYLKSSDIVIPKIKAVKPKKQNRPPMNQPLISQQKQKLQLQKKKFNDQFNQQRQQMLSKYRQQKEQKMPKKPQNQFLLNDGAKKNLQSKLQQQQQYLHVQKLPKSQMNQYKPSSRPKAKVPALIQPTMKQIQQQQQRKKQKMEIQKIESIDNKPFNKCDDENERDDDFYEDNDNENNRRNNDDNDDDDNFRNDDEDGDKNNDDDDDDDGDDDDDEEDDEENENENNYNNKNDDDDDDDFSKVFSAGDDDDDDDNDNNDDSNDNYKDNDNDNYNDNDDDDNNKNYDGMNNDNIYTKIEKYPSYPSAKKKFPSSPRFNLGVEKSLSNDKHFSPSKGTNNLSEMVLIVPKMKEKNQI